MPARALTRRLAAGITAPMVIYKIFRAPEAEAFDRDKTSRGAPVDLSDGYIHFSTRAQLEQTLAKHFAQETGLVLLALEADGLGPELKWEPSRGGQLFPHLYRPLEIADVLWSAPIEDGPGGHVLPARAGTDAGGDAAQTSASARNGESG
ncbi:DUF952 domain-containing protein [Profundibacterium mesophilum]|uniref:Glutathione S-transferase n=1 Tax=Profundibacterium mesophilum KAUST100406-0324 TaxID=1037889 RepID=A0A921TB03_9RHOB|nr:DUF952 domain-containing protein [Profundibacterium mesophilum]KAF0674535.1 glutathione S-transferase [Profundibacterium mesophilum KAUST100406-0324]